jgi:hypothetical protein
MEGKAVWEHASSGDLDPSGPFDYHDRGLRGRGEWRQAVAHQHPRTAIHGL